MRNFYIGESHDYSVYLPTTALYRMSSLMLLALLLLPALCFWTKKAFLEFWLERDAEIPSASTSPLQSHQPKQSGLPSKISLSGGGVTPVAPSGAPVYFTYYYYFCTQFILSTCTSSDTGMHTQINTYLQFRESYTVEKSAERRTGRCKSQLLSGWVDLHKVFSVQYILLCTPC